MIQLSVPMEAREKHWVYISKDTAKRVSLLSRLYKRLNNLKDDVCRCKEYFAEINLNTKYSCPCSINLSLRKLYREVFKFVIQNLYEIVTGNVNVIKKLLNEFYNVTYEIRRNNMMYILIEELKKLFISTYTSFSNGVIIQGNGESSSVWGAYEYVKLLESTVCPYCNAQFTLIIENNVGEKGKTRPDLDHFLPKHIHPLFAISLYNLVPSCKICNSSLKGQQDTSFEKNFNPYEDNIEDCFRFSRNFIETEKEDVVPNYIQGILGESENYDLKIQPVYNSINKKEKKVIANKVDGNIKLFHLEKVYKYHKLHIQKMILNARIYNLVYQQQLKNNFPDVFSSEDQVLSLIQYNSEEMKYTILSKVFTDISRFELSLNND